MRKTNRILFVWLFSTSLFLGMVPAFAAGTTVEADASYSITVVEPPCNLSALPLGGVCHDGTRQVVYVGQLNATRLYTNTEDPPPSSFSTQEIYTDATSMSDGVSNTNKLLARVDGSYPMAQACRSLGSDWYLASINELSVLYQNRATVAAPAGLNVIGAVDVYYSSSDSSTSFAYHLNMANGAVYSYSHPKIPPWTFKYRCFRR